MPWQCERSDRIFVIRLWCESPSDESTLWRGSVYDNRSGVRSMFSNVRDLVDVIGLRLTDQRLSIEATTRTDDIDDDN